MADAILLAGDRYHKAEDAFAGVGPALESAGLEVEYTTDFECLDSKLLEGKRVLVILRDGMEWPNGHEEPHEVWMHPDQEEAVEAFVRSGGGFLPLHNSGWAYPWRGPYRRVLGGYYQGHPPVLPFEVRVVNRDHPITSGVSDFEIVDEQHFLWFDYERVELLLKASGGMAGNRRRAGRTSMEKVASPTWRTATPWNSCCTRWCSCSCTTPCAGCFGLPMEGGCNAAGSRDISTGQGLGRGDDYRQLRGDRLRRSRAAHHPCPRGRGGTFRRGARRGARAFR